MQWERSVDKYSIGRHKRTKKAVKIEVAGGSQPAARKRRRKKKKKTRKDVVKDQLMNIWDKMIFPVKHVWLALFAPVKPRKNGAGHVKLHNDIKMCGYEDVQVMWELLRRTESELVLHTNPKRKQRPFWRFLYGLMRAQQQHPHGPTAKSQAKLNT